MSVQATLDSIARRLLREELQADPSEATAWTNHRDINGVSDDRSPLNLGEAVPIVHRNLKDTIQASPRSETSCLFGPWPNYAASISSRETGRSLLVGSNPASRRRSPNDPKGDR